MSTIPSTHNGSSSNGALAPGSTTGTRNANLSLTPSDFIKLMVTQLEHQDPTQPTTNQDLLAQMSQIGQLQSSTQLQTTLSSITLQTQIGSSGNLIGKNVQGLDDNDNAVSGTVNSVKVQNSTVYLQLDSGSTLQLGKVTSISAPPSTTAGATPAK